MSNLAPTTHARAKRRRRRGGGFTLIVVLAALLLAGIVLPVALRCASLASGAADTARRHTEAAALARSKLSELVSTGDWQTSAGRGGTFGADWPDYRWSASVQNWTFTKADLRQLDVEVTWPARGGAGGVQSVTLSTLVYPGPPDDNRRSRQGGRGAP
jgi:type II secretory pathway pseudopilin PulG